jgi:hypothetical protein
MGGGKVIIKGRDLEQFKDLRDRVLLTKRHSKHKISVLLDGTYLDLMVAKIPNLRNLRLVISDEQGQITSVGRVVDNEFVGGWGIFEPHTSWSLKSKYKTSYNLSAVDRIVHGTVTINEVRVGAGLVGLGLVDNVIRYVE